MKIIVIGTNKSGKTSIVRRLAGDCFYEDKYESELESLHMNYCYSVGEKLLEKELQITELSQTTCFTQPTVVLEHVKKADGIIFVYSADQNANVLDCTFARLFRACKQKKRHCSIIYMRNKCDTIDSSVINSYLENVLLTDVEEIPDKFDVSAKTNDGISEAFLYLLKSCLKR